VSLPKVEPKRSEDIEGCSRSTVGPLAIIYDILAYLLQQGQS
jgi:hypothetical protein